MIGEDKILDPLPSGWGHVPLSSSSPHARGVASLRIQPHRACVPAVGAAAAHMMPRDKSSRARVASSGRRCRKVFLCRGRRQFVGAGELNHRAYAPRWYEEELCVVVRPGSSSGTVPGACLHPGGHHCAVSTGGRCRCFACQGFTRLWPSRRRRTVSRPQRLLSSNPQEGGADWRGKSPFAPRRALV